MFSRLLSPVAYLIGGSLVISIAYIVLGGYVLRAYDGRGVRALGGFAVLWGLGNGIFNATDLYLHVSLGITTQQQYATAGFSQTFELFLAVETVLSVLLTTVAPFVWVAFVLNYTTQLQPKHRRVYTGIVVLVTGLVLLLTGPSVLNTLGLNVEVANAFLFLTGLVVIGSQIGVAGAGVAQMYKTSQQYQQISTVEALAVAAPLLVLFNNAANNLGLYNRFVSIYSVYFVLHIVGLIGFSVATERYDLLGQLPVANTVARDTAIDTVDVGIVVLDTEDRVVDLNETAESLINTNGTGRIGQPYREVHASFADVDLSSAGRRVIGFPGDRTGD
jgi:hypothetical protein